MDVSTPMTFLTNIWSIYGINIAQVKVSLTNVTYQVVLKATKCAGFAKTCKT